MRLGAHPQAVVEVQDVQGKGELGSDSVQGEQQRDAVDATAAAGDHLGAVAHQAVLSQSRAELGHNHVLNTFTTSAVAAGRAADAGDSPTDVVRCGWHSRKRPHGTRSAPGGFTPVGHVGNACKRRHYRHGAPRLADTVPGVRAEVMERSIRPATRPKSDVDT